MQFQIPLFTAVKIADTANTANAAVVRDTDKSVNVGQCNMTYHNNSGGVVMGGIVSKAISFTFDTTAIFWIGDATAGAIVGTLTAASASSGALYYVTRANTGSNAVFIKGSGTDNIISSGTVANTTSLTAIGHQVSLWCDGTQWWLK